MIDVKLFTERLDFIDARIKNKYERHKIENNSFLNNVYDDHLLINLIIDIDNPNTDHQPHSIVTRKKNNKQVFFVFC